MLTPGTVDHMSKTAVPPAIEALVNTSRMSATVSFFAGVRLNSDIFAGVVPLAV